MKLKIRATASCVPQKSVSNADLAKTIGTSDEWIVSHTGIRSRYIAETESASDLGAAAGQSAIEQCGIFPHDVDMIIVATSTPDYASFPATACVIQQKLGIQQCVSYDITAACSGFVFALSNAVNALRCKEARTVLVIGTEVFSKIINWKDRNTCILFGDGAGAVIVVAEDSNTNTMPYTVLGCTPADIKCLARVPRTDVGDDTTARFVEMDGKKVYDFAVKSLVQTTKALAKKASITLNDIDFIVPHQANIRIIHAAANRLGLPKEKFFINIEHYANTSAATIPIALTDMQKKGMITAGSCVAMIGFGAGLTYGGILWEW